VVHYIYPIYIIIYFGLYVVVIIKVKIEEKKEPRVKWILCISFVSIWRHVSSQGPKSKVERLN
jgi:uncharacterized membrane protein